MSAPTLGTVLGMPISLALCAVAVLTAVLLVVAAVAWAVLRRTPAADLPIALLGLAHIISALSGLLPWGRPAQPPALPQVPAPDPPEPEAPSLVMLVRAQAEDPQRLRGGTRDVRDH